MSDALARPAATHAPDRTGRLLPRTAAVAEVLLAFALVHAAFRSFKYFTRLGQAEVAAGLNFSPGTVMILFTVTVLWLRRADFRAYGLTLDGWRSGLSIGLLWAVVYVAGAVVFMRLTGFRGNPLSPPSVPLAAVVTLGELLNLTLIWLLRRDRGLIQQLPAAVSVPLIGGLVYLPLGLAWWFGRPPAPALLAALWNFFGAGVGEEVFFRGYIQSRLNEAFGRPFRLLGVDFGVGLLVSSALFGFVHVLNPVQYFGGDLDFAWLRWLPQAASGLFFGLLREKTGSILAGAVIHGLSDVATTVPPLLPPVRGGPT